MKNKVSLLFIALAFFSVKSFAGEVFTYVDKNSKQIAFRLMISETHVKFDTYSNGGQSTSIFDLKNERIQIINYVKKNYIEISKAEIPKIALAHLKKTVGSSVSDSVERAKAIVDIAKKASPEIAEVKVTKIKSDVRVNEWKGDHYQAFSNDKLFADTIISSTSNLGVPEKSLSSFKRMVSFQYEILKNLPTKMLEVYKLAEWEKYDGFPVSSTHIGTKTPVSFILRTLEKKEISKNNFKTPDGFNQVQLGL